MKAPIGDAAGFIEFALIDGEISRRPPHIDREQELSQIGHRPKDRFGGRRERDDVFEFRLHPRRRNEPIAAGSLVADHSGGLVAPCRG